MKRKYLFIFTLILILIVIIFVIFIFKNGNRIELSFVFENYLNEEIPLFYQDNDLNEVRTVLVDDIKQIFYAKNESTEYYSYLTINDIKYDIGSAHFSDIENSNYILTKTEIFKDNYPIYKYYIYQGANYNDSVYFQIVDNKPIILMKIPNGFEFDNNNEIMTYTSRGISSSSSIYRWTDNGLYVSDLNTFFDAQHVQFEPSSNVISLIKEVDFQNPENNKVKKYKLKGTSIYDYWSIIK